MKKIAIIILTIVVTSCTSSYEVIHISNTLNKPSIVYVKKVTSNSNEVFELIPLPKKENIQNSTLIQEGEVYELKLKKSLKIYSSAYNGKTNLANRLRDSVKGHVVIGNYYCPNLYGLYLHEKGNGTD